ncbi:MAG: tRNA (adenosine(37)-N6)-dimethylallyltransferase MiaA [Vicinamibacterales bacterium]
MAVLGATATGKSRLGIALAQRFDGEIVNCDSTAVYRRFDIGTDKVAPEERHGIPHHLIDIVEPIEAYSAAQYATQAARVVREILDRGKLPILVGGTGFYYRALTRGLFPGPSRDGALRARLQRVIEHRGPERVHRWLARVDPASGRRIHPHDIVRVVRALEVYLATRVPLSTHFAETRSPLGDLPVAALALQLPAPELAERLAVRVDSQFARGIVREVQAILASGVPETAHPFSGLVYRQVLEMLHGVRDEADTRALIVRENRRYARRQLIWFKKEPNLRWFPTPGERAETADAAAAWVRTTHVLV